MKKNQTAEKFLEKSQWTLKGASKVSPLLQNFGVPSQTFQTFFLFFKFIAAVVLRVCSVSTATSGTPRSRESLNNSLLF